MVVYSTLLTVVDQAHDVPCTPRETQIMNLYMTEDSLKDLTTANLRQVQELAIGRFLRLGSVPMPTDPVKAAETLKVADACVALTKAAARIIRARGDA